MIAGRPVSKRPRHPQARRKCTRNIVRKNQPTGASSAMVSWRLCAPFQDCLVFERQQDREEQFKTIPQSRHYKLTRGSSITPCRCQNHCRVEHKHQLPIILQAILHSKFIRRFRRPSMGQLFLDTRRKYPPIPSCKSSHALTSDHNECR